MILTLLHITKETYFQALILRVCICQVSFETAIKITEKLIFYGWYNPNADAAGHSLHMLEFNDQSHLHSLFFNYFCLKG